MSPSGGRSGGPRRPAGSPTIGAKGVSAAAVFDALSRHLPADAVVTVDVGNHAYSLGRYLESAGQPVLMSGYLGSIGFGYPAALGAWAADPSRPIVAVTGDGGFGQYAMELTTAVKYGIGHQARPAGQQGPGQDRQGTAGRRLPRLAHLAAQPGLGRVRPVVRRDRHPGQRQLPTSMPR